MRKFKRERESEKCVRMRERALGSPINREYCGVIEDREHISSHSLLFSISCTLLPYIIIFPERPLSVEKWYSLSLTHFALSHTLPYTISRSLTHALSLIQTHTLRSHFLSHSITKFLSSNVPEYIYAGA